MNNLVMPKADGRMAVLMAVLSYFYQKTEPISQAEYKKEIVPYLEPVSNSKDSLAHVKKMELARYFGLISSTDDRKHFITDRGRRYYQAENGESRIDIIFESLEVDKFGRENDGVDTSDSDIDPPIMYLKSMKMLGGITSEEFASILYMTNDLGMSYEDVISIIVDSRNSSKNSLIKVIAENNLQNKYYDIKFKGFFNELGIVEINKSIQKISDNVMKMYRDRIDELNIYNCLKGEEITVTPESILRINDEQTEESIEDELVQKKISQSSSYNTDEEIYRANNRIPKVRKTTLGKRYSTNPRVAKTVLEKSSYTCIVDENHKSFSTSLGNQYMEAHHFIPMKAQEEFITNLDRTENIVPLCPICHRAIHHGNNEVKLELVKNIFDKVNDRIHGSNIKLKGKATFIEMEEIFERYYK